VFSEKIFSNKFDLFWTATLFCQLELLVSLLCQIDTLFDSEKHLHFTLIFAIEAGTWEYTGLSWRPIENAKIWPKTFYNIVKQVFYEKRISLVSF